MAATNAAVGKVSFRSEKSPDLTPVFPYQFVDTSALRASLLARETAEDDCGSEERWSTGAAFSSGAPHLLSSAGQLTITWSGGEPVSVEARTRKRWPSAANS